MKKLVLVFAAICLSQVALANDFVGKWNTEKSDEGAWLTVDIQPCGEELCGTIAEVHNSENTDLVGTEMIKGMRQKSESSYSKGKIYAPDTEKWYNSNMKIEEAGKLKVAGCVFVICRSQVWTRAE